MEKKLIYDGTVTKAIVKNENEHIQKNWMVGRFYETQRNGMLNVIYESEKKGGKFIDIGASIGNHTLFFANVMKGQVIAFEPQFDSYIQLRDNIELNHLTVTTFNAALGDRKGLVRMKSNSPDNVGMYQVDESGIGNTVLQTLDRYEHFVGGYDVIKIDVEHYNKKLLTGAAEVLTNGRGNVYIEAETPEILKETDDIMATYGYYRIPGLVMNHTPTYLYVKVKPIP